MEITSRKFFDLNTCLLTLRTSAQEIDVDMIRLPSGRWMPEQVRFYRRDPAHGLSVRILDNPGWVIEGTRSDAIRAMGGA